MKFEWETIAPGVMRAKVFGGWIVENFTAFSTAMAFVPDPNHEWVIDG